MFCENKSLYGMNALDRVFSNKFELYIYINICIVHYTQILAAVMVFSGEFNRLNCFLRNLTKIYIVLSQALCVLQKL